MSRITRLRSSRDFAQVRKHGQSQHHPLFVLSYVRNDQSMNRFGFVTSKRIGNAITRNRAKRIMREAARRCSSMIKLGYDIVMIARTPIIEASSIQVESALCGVLSHTVLYSGQDR